MRILITNPDTIGDVVLREPLFRVLAEAGHELALIVQPLVQPLARVVAPGARLIELSMSVYDGRIEPDDERLDPVIDAVEDFDPDMIVGAPFTWTMLEDRLAEAFSDVRRIGQAGGRFIDPWHGRETEPRAPFDEIVRVNEDLHELRKSEALARAVLAKPVHLPNPRLELADEHRQAADAVLARLGLKRGEFTAACVGHHRHTAIRNWRPERWVKAIAHLMKRYDRQVLLLGGQDEAEASQAIGESLEAKGHEPRYWFGGSEGDTLLLTALLEASRGYIGRDTGPMHIAAAVGKPVLAVFGGGTWPRFRPLVAPSVSITLAVPCSPCDWRCEQRRSHCIKDVPLHDVIEQIDRLEQGSIERAEVRQLEPSRATLVGIASQAADAAQQYKVELSITKSKLTETKKRQDQEIRRNSMSETALLQRLDKLEQSIQNSGQASRQAEEAQRRASEITQKLTQNNQALQQARQELAQAAQRAEAADQQRSSLADELQALRQQLAKETTRADGLERELEETRTQRDAAEREATALRAKYANVDLPALRQNLKTARQLVGSLQGEKHDLTMRSKRLLQERQAIEKLADQRLVTIQGLEHKLRLLLASRWRQVGQRMRVAVVLPWEEAERNRLLGAGSNGHAGGQPAKR